MKVHPRTGGAFSFATLFLWNRMLKKVKKKIRLLKGAKDITLKKFCRKSGCPKLTSLKYCEDHKNQEQIYNRSG